MAKKSRTAVITANWKMHKTIGESLEFIDQLKPMVESASSEVYLAVPFTAVRSTAEALAGTTIVVGAQNMNDASEGAFTGEVAGKMLVEAGAKFVILGHSERRHLFGESSEFINKKVHRAVEVGLQPIVCVGETKEEHEAGKAEKVVEQQIKESLKGLKAKELETLILAYEPVWAIGTGLAASPKDAQKMHACCRKNMAKVGSQAVADKMCIQYGGSVRPSNARELMKQSDIDGLLVGGASLSSNTFSQIVNYES